MFPDDQRGLWALSCFSGGAPLAATEAVLARLGVPQASAVDVVSRLVARSLVNVEISHEGAVRYRLLDSIRAYALDRLRESGLYDTAAAAHATWYANVADRCATTVRGHGQADSVATVRAERANIDAALAWAAAHDPPLGVRIALGLEGASRRAADGRGMLPPGAIGVGRATGPDPGASAPARRVRIQSCGTLDPPGDRGRAMRTGRGRPSARRLRRIRRVGTVLAAATGATHRLARWIAPALRASALNACSCLASRCRCGQASAGGAAVVNGEGLNPLTTR